MENNSVTVTLIGENGTLVLPNNPEVLEISTASNNTTINVLKMGEIIIPGETKLASFQVSSFFWKANDEREPKDGLEFLKNLQLAEKPFRFVVSGSVAINKKVVIESLNYKHSAGEEEDIYFTLTLKEYRDYGATPVTGV